MHSEALSSLGRLEDMLVVVAWSGDPVLKEDGQLQKSRCKEDMVSSRCIEAVSSLHDPPLIATQWHAEAYDPDSPQGRVLLHALSSLLSQQVTRNAPANSGDSAVEEVVLQPLSAFTLVDGGEEAVSPTPPGLLPLPPQSKRTEDAHAEIDPQFEEIVQPFATLAVARDAALLKLGRLPPPCNMQEKLYTRTCYLELV